MFAKAVISSPHTPKLHTKEKEASHKAHENAKTLYGCYNSVNGGQIFFHPVDMLLVIVGHVKKGAYRIFLSNQPWKICHCTETAKF